MLLLEEKMMELISIIFQLSIFFILFSINPFVINKISYNKIAVSYNENISFNFLIFANLILILSIFSLNISQIINFYLIYVSLFYLILFKKKLTTISKTKKKDYFYDFIILFLFSAVVLIDISNKLVISWDAEKFWLNKTLSFYNGFSIENLQNLNRTHYPFLGGLINSFFWKLSLIDFEYSNRLILGFIYCLSLILLIENLLIPRIYKLILLLLFLIISYDYYKLFSGNQEILVFSFICFTVNSFYKIKNKKDINLNIFIILLSCNLLIWTKPEGIFYAFFIILTLFFVKSFKLKEKFYLLMFLFFILSIKIIVFKIYNLQVSLSHVAPDLSFHTLIFKFEFNRVIMIFKYFIFALFQNYYLLFGLVLLLINKILRNQNLYIDFYILINLSFIFLVYLFVEHSNVTQEFILKTGIERLIFNISPIIILVFIEIINKKKSIFNKYHG